MRQKEPEADRILGEIKRDSPLWREIQAETLRKGGQMAGECHPWIGVVQCGIFLRDPDLVEKPVRLGTAYYCPFEDFDKKINKIVECHKVQRRYKIIRSILPQDWRAEVWDMMREAGPYLPQGGPDFALYCERRGSVLESCRRPFKRALI